MILAIDPGRKPGYVLLDESFPVVRRFFSGGPAVVWAGMHCPTVPVQAIVVEGQWLHGAKNKQAILELAAIRGWQSCAATRSTGCTAVHVLRPKEWRSALGAGGSTKVVLQSRCLASLTTTEVQIVAASGATPARLGDIYDAILLGWAFAKAGGSKWKEPP